MVVSLKKRQNRICDSFFFVYSRNTVLDTVHCSRYRCVWITRNMRGCLSTHIFRPFLSLREFRHNNVTLPSVATVVQKPGIQSKYCRYCTAVKYRNTETTHETSWTVMYIYHAYSENEKYPTSYSGTY